MADLVLKSGRERSLLRRHPWIFSSAIYQINGDPSSGETVDLLSAKGEFLARAAFSPHSRIKARVWTFKEQQVGEQLFRHRIRAAIHVRDLWNLSSETDAIRIIHAESDGLPGLIVDRYRDVLVLQSLTAGSERWKQVFADILLEETGLNTIYERSDVDVRALEGLDPAAGFLRGTKIVSPFMIHESSLQFRVDLQGGHKTGFYLDQRENRKRVRELAKDRDVLDCFCYSGGFTVSAAAGGAKSIVAVDSSADALALGRENLEHNRIQPEGVEWIEGDVFRVLRDFRDEGRSFDMIILDPPKFAPTTAQVDKASRGYKDINRLAFLMLRQGGLLVTFSCSGGVDSVLFQKIVASAALDAGVEAQIVKQLSQGQDHPVSLHFPEGAYLKGLICVVNR
jgi:23S rRNA (cytosine1962-C5)-methyltransferase